MMLSKEKLSNRGRGKRALAYILLIAVCVIIIYPLLWTIGASFNPGNSLVSTSIIPKILQMNITLSYLQEKAIYL